MRLLLPTWIVGLVVGSHLVCAPARGQSTDVAALAGYLGPDREQRLVEGARKEGELTLYTSMQMESSAPLLKAFEDKYGIKFRIWRGAGKDILRRAVAEAQANRADLDIVESDGFALEALYRETLLQAVKSPYHADLIPEALRPQGQWVGTRVNIFTGVYNTNLMKRETLPRRYEDLLDPRFKGALGIEADDYDWFGMIVGLLGEETGLKLFRDIVATNSMSVRKGHTLLTNLVAAGEVPIGLTVFMQNVDVAKKNGAPIESFLIPPAVARPNGIAMAKRAPHPHAALLFYDFMLSDGQQIMLKREFVPTSRKISSVLERITLNFVDPAIVLDGGAKWQKLYSDVVRNAGR
jgi:iron(III) transport system substrate-binding protein